MIKLPKKIAKTIEQNFGNNVTIVKRINMQSIYKGLCANLVVFTINQGESFIILRYFEDNSYSFLGNFSREEITEELAHQIKTIQ